ncbi:MAG TPA: GNAT family N-acetyltransferase [Verrucomicrobiae bacterium]|nr:GNAT family N-acetyltransferase [Verrucomicrobiae bacterium]
MKALLRHVQNADLDRLLALYARFEPKGEFQGLPPLTPRQTAEWLRHVRDIGSAEFVIEVARSIVGHSMLCPGPSKSEAEFAVFMRQDFRGLGLGKALTLGTLNYGCKQLQLDRVWLSVQGSNPRALHLFERVGFHSVKKTDPFAWELAMERPSHCVECKGERCLVFGAALPRTLEVTRRRSQAA